MELLEERASEESDSLIEVMRPRELEERDSLIADPAEGIRPTENNPANACPPRVSHAPAQEGSTASPAVAYI
jgi:hypothetical protein